MKSRLVFSNYDHLRNPYYAGGGARALHEVAKRLTERHEVTIVTGKYPGCSNGLLEGVQYEHAGCSGLGPKLGQLCFHFALPIEARKRAHDLWLESLTPPFSTACLQLFTRKPVVLVTQNLIGKAMARKYKLPFHWFERVGLKTYRYGIALSEPLRKDLLKANPTMRVTVIPNGVEPALIQQKVENQGEHILFLGRIDLQQKGLDLLLDALARTGKDFSTPLVIAGSGIRTEEETLTRRIGELGLSNRVRLVGNVTGEKKAEVFQRALFLVMPSRFEGFPLTLLEAFCWELPVILFAIPELAWLPDSCCAKISPFDVEAFGTAIGDLVRNNSHRQAMARAAKEWVKSFSWDEIAKQYENFFVSIIRH